MACVEAVRFIAPVRSVFWESVGQWER